MKRSIALGALATLLVVGALSWFLLTRQPISASSVQSPLL